MAEEIIFMILWLGISAFIIGALLWFKRKLQRKRDRQDQEKADALINIVSLINP